MNIKDIKKEFDNKKIIEIERSADASAQKAISGRKEFIRALYYLEHTGRYKENATYKNAKFDKYLNDRFCMRLTTYESERWTFVNFPDESETIGKIYAGPGLVASIKKKCGTKKVAAVLGEIKKADGARKTPLTRDGIQKIIDRHRKPARTANKSLSAVVLEKKYDKIKDENIRLHKTIKEQNEQIGKLKATVLEYKNKYESLLKVAGPIALHVQESNVDMVAVQ